LKDITEEQKEEDSIYYPKVKDKDLIIDWNNLDAKSVKNLVRSSNPKYQGAVTFFRNIPIRILEVSIENETRKDILPGQIIDPDLRGNIKVVCKNGDVLSIHVLYANEGCFSGCLFKSIFNIQPGEFFVTPNNLQ
jgi:methionyl-tRNA formyltransferase